MAHGQKQDRQHSNQPMAIWTPKVQFKITSLTHALSARLCSVFFAEAAPRPMFQQTVKSASVRFRSSGRSLWRCGRSFRRLRSRISILACSCLATFHRCHFGLSVLGAPHKSPPKFSVPDLFPLSSNVGLNFQRQVRIARGAVVWAPTQFDQHEVGNVRWFLLCMKFTWEASDG